MPFKSLLDLTGEKLGEGHFGVVLKGQHALHSDVAIKALKQGKTETPEQFTARTTAIIGQEGAALKAVEHINVVRVHDVVYHRPTSEYCLVVQFCNGGSLESEYKNGPIAIEKVRQILDDVIAGLNHVHDKGLLHRDIKPGNILIHDGVYKVSDFGLARDSDGFGYASAAGYTDHLAPEVFSDRRTSVKTDVWALGMTAYRLLHGHSFYEEVKRESAIVDRITTGKFAESLKWLPHIPDEWRRFIRAMLHHDKDQRLQDMHSVRQKLSSIPATPNWACTHSTVGTIWTRTKPDGRTFRVERTIQSALRHSWVATLSGAAKRTISYGDATDLISPSAAEKALTDFFEGIGAT